MDRTGASQLVIDDDTLSSWQQVVDLMAESCQVSAGLIMRITGQDIEVFVSSHYNGNPYKVGERETLLGSGLYCEHVLRSRRQLLVPNALADAEWRNNPDVKLNMIAYLGYPIVTPAGNVFGTICVLDQKENQFGVLYERLLEHFKEHIELDIAAAENRRQLAQRNDALTEALARVKTLEGILPICQHCKKIRIEEGDSRDEKAWFEPQVYLRDHTEAQFSHGICPECLRKHYPDYPE